MAKLRGLYHDEIDFTNTMLVSQNSVLSKLNCHNIGKIIAFNSTNQTVDVELMQIKQFNDKYITPTVMTDVPLIIYGTKDSYITLPDLTGTTCILLFMDRNIDNFIETGEQYVPETGRMHDFTDCIAITTFKTMADKITNYDSTALTIWYNKTISDILYQSYIKNFGNSIEAKTQYTDEDENNKWCRIKIDNKVNVQNDAQNLASLIQEFLVACENIAVNTQTGVITSTSKQAFTNLKTKFEGLLQ